MYRYILIFLLLLSACKEKPKTENNSTDTDEKKETSIHTFSDTISNTDSNTDSNHTGNLSKDTVTVEKHELTGGLKPEYFEGIFITNLSSKTFRDCRYPDSVYWVMDDTKKLEGEYSKIFSEKSVYNSVYVKVKGEIENTENTAISEDYPRTLRVMEVEKMERKNSANTCVPYDFWGFGSDNSWSLEISRYENLIEFIIPSEKKTYYFFYNEPTEQDGLIIYKSHNLVQRYNIEIRLRKESCTDTKSGKIYDYAIYININGDKVYYGCALKGKVNK